MRHISHHHHTFHLNALKNIFANGVRSKLHVLSYYLTIILLLLCLILHKSYVLSLHIITGKQDKNTH